MERACVLGKLKPPVQGLATEGTGKNITDSTCTFAAKVDANMAPGRGVARGPISQQYSHIIAEGAIVPHAQNYHIQGRNKCTTKAMWKELFSLIQK